MNKSRTGKQADNQEELSLELKKALISLSRTAIEKHVRNESIESPEKLLKSVSSKYNLSKEDLEFLKSKKGCFVTLNIYNDEALIFTYSKGPVLRGCIGTILPIEPLYRCIYNNAINAALHDPRFPPLSKEELKHIETEISILTTPKELPYSDANDLKRKLTKDDGVVLSYGFYKATFLPQVWEQLKDPEEFLSELCLKAGLPEDAWKNKKLTIETYRVIAIRENQLKEM
ncbi:MAG: uncharacterized protein PWR30_488 [Candidatus Woesearchaeota archaeon]|nr:uncharacterized protein [Candidatus Woesearchaeota archaeon]